jgi:lipid-binding SYLF domain-containing protein
MNRQVQVKVVSVLLTLGGLCGTAGAQQSDEAAQIRDAALVFEEIMKAPKSAIPKAILDKAEAIAVFPSLTKEGLMVGRQRGRGIVSVRSPQSRTWSAPGFLTLSGGSLGAQIGKETVDVVCVVVDRRGVDTLTRDSFIIGADMAAAAGPVGTTTDAKTDAQMRAQILTYTRSRGLFAGVTVSRTSVKEDLDANERFYGRRYRTSEIVIDRISGVPDPVVEWRDMLAKYF